MDGHVKDITQLAAVAGKPPRAAPRNSAYDFVQLGDTLADSMVAAADDLMNEAHAIADRTRRLAVEIRNAVDEQSKILADINAKLKSSGEAMLEAHRRFTGT